MNKVLAKKLIKSKAKDCHADDPKFKSPGNKPMTKTIGSLYPHMKDYDIHYKKKTVNE